MSYSHIQRSTLITSPQHTCTCISYISHTTHVHVYTCHIVMYNMYDLTRFVIAYYAHARAHARALDGSTADSSETHARQKGFYKIQLSLEPRIRNAVNKWCTWVRVLLNLILKMGQTRLWSVRKFNFRIFKYVHVYIYICIYIYKVYICIRIYIHVLDHSWLGRLPVPLRSGARRNHHPRRRGANNRTPNRHGDLVSLRFWCCIPPGPVLVL